MAIELNEQNFSNEIEKFPGVALVDFWAPWCGPCKMQGPIVEEISQELANQTQVKIAKLNVDDNQSIAEKHQVLSIPTLKIFKNGQVVEEMVGVQDKKSLLEKINKHQS